MGTINWGKREDLRELLGKRVDGLALISHRGGAARRVVGELDCYDAYDDTCRLIEDDKMGAWVYADSVKAVDAPPTHEMSPVGDLSFCRKCGLREVSSGKTCEPVSPDLIRDRIEHTIYAHMVIADHSRGNDVYAASLRDQARRARQAHFANVSASLTVVGGWNRRP